MKFKGRQHLLMVFEIRGGVTLGSGVLPGSENAGFLGGGRSRPWVWVLSHSRFTWRKFSGPYTYDMHTFLYGCCPSIKF